MLKRTYQIECDGCRYPARQVATSEFDAYDAAIAEGVMKQSGKDLCKPCRDKARALERLDKPRLPLR